MKKVLLAVLAVTVFAGVRGSAQPARPAIPPDIAGEWRLDNNEQDTTAQPPLGDYLGIPFNDITQCALIPVAYTKGTNFSAGPRKALDPILHVDRW